MAFFLNSYNIPTCMFIGKYLFMPDDGMDLTIVVGTNIELPCIAEPSLDDVNKWHTTVLDSYMKLFDKFKGKYASSGSSAQLEIM